MIESTYEAVAQIVRPPRALIAYDSAADWRAGARAALRYLSRVWGGLGGAVLPYSDVARPARPLLRLLRHHDPDLLCWLRLSAADLEPAAMRGWAERAGLGIGDAERVREVATVSDLGTWPAPTGLLALAADWLANLQPYGDEVLLLLDGEPPDPLIPVDRAAPRPAFAVDLTGLDANFALMLATRVGDVRDDGQVEARLPLLEQDLNTAAAYAMLGPETRPGWSPPKAWVDAAAEHGTIIEQALPFPRTSGGIGWLVSALDRHPALVVVGDTAADHALAVACDRTMHTAAWAPDALLDAKGPEGDAARYALTAFLHHRWNPSRPVDTIVTSISEPLERLHDLVRRHAPADATTSSPDRHRNVRVVVTDADELPLPSPKLLADPASLSNRDEYEVATDADGNTVTRAGVPTPRPASSATGVDSWYVDATVGRRSRLPARPSVAPLLLADPPPDVPDAVIRAGRDGHAYWCRTQGLVLAGQPEQLSLVRPRLRVPGAFDVFAALAAASGSAAHISTAGRRARNAVAMWGNVEDATRDLRGSVRGLLDAFAATAKDGPYGGGIAVRRTGYLTADHAAAALTVANAAAARVTLDRLLLRGILHRGLLLRCERCERLDFYRIEQVGSTFACGQCEHTNPLTQPRWHKPDDEPLWFYDLDVIVRDLLAQNGDVPILAVDRLVAGRRRRPPLASSFELQLTRHGEDRPWAELDIAAVIDGRIVVGEAKSVNTLKTSDKSVAQAAQRLADASVALTADAVVLATTHTEWTPGNVDAVRGALERAAKNTRPLPEIIVVADTRK